MENIKNLLSHINWSTLSIPQISISDIIDIFIVAFVIYKIMIWVKQTRAWSLFKGGAIIIVVSFLAYIFNFYTVIWIIQTCFNAGLIAVIILFQPELRKALEEIGKGKINMPFTSMSEENKELTNHTILEIIKAAKIMASAKTGALILIEQDVAVGDHEQTGIAIDAVVSSQLLINIFENKTPLHDGAVIIRNNRIAAASCILPLTQAEIGRELGTRHRAAVGASEVCDAFILVVSEETGHISIAKGGKLYRNLSEEKILKMLTGNLKPEKKRLTLWKGRLDNEKNS